MYVCVWGGGTSDFFNYKWEAEVITAKVCEEEYLAEDWAVVVISCDTNCRHVMVSLIQVSNSGPFK